MRLDVIVPTYNRQDLLPLSLNSLFAAEIPAGLEVSVTVVDNNSTDGTRQVIESLKPRFGDRLQYCFEQQQGRSHALNAGINATSGELVGIIDDDEEVDRNWINAAFEAFTTKDLDFIGGPYIPHWSVTPPDWLPREYGGVVGWVDGGDKEVPFDRNYPGILMGGNVVLKRSILEKVGLYTTWLGRTDKGLLTGEDEELYGRLLASGAKGMYLPQMMIYHHIPPERLTKSYFRRWCFWRGVSLGLLDRTRRLPVPYLFGIPRWHYRKAFQGLLSTMRHVVVKSQNPAQAFAAELGVWDWLGLVYGRHFRKANELVTGK
ncbi:MAG TPA: glycosyltransferase [Pyrinomonadaceae bacterium]|jgi:glycosyltransferase involved in cell wall biosynthesis|nr:glycosyltransferase [Pyrinomonadaceae bacterium]